MSKPEPIPGITLDNSGRNCDIDLIGTIWQHSGNNKYYEVVGYSWCAERNLWLIEYYRMGGIHTKYSRSIENFEGKRADVPRFKRMEKIEEQFHALLKEESNV